MTIGEIIAGLAAAGTAGCLLIGVYFVGERDGFSQAALQCRETSVAAELKAAHARYVNLQAQIKAQAAVLAKRENAARKLQDLLSQAKARIITVRVAKDCTVGKDAIDALNSVRKAGAP